MTRRSCESEANGLVHPSLANWAKETRLNPRGGIARHRDTLTVIQAYERIQRLGAAVAINLVKLLSPSDSSPASSQTSGGRRVHR